MGALIFLLIFVALDLVAIRWGVDTRTVERPPRPLLVAERMSTTRAGPGGSGRCPTRTTSDPVVVAAFAAFLAERLPMLEKEEWKERREELRTREAPRRADHAARR